MLIHFQRIMNDASQMLIHFLKKYKPSQSVVNPWTKSTPRRSQPYVKIEKTKQNQVNGDENKLVINIKYP